MRLPVILVQNPPASGAAMADALVGNLIGRAGLDLTLVDRFETLSADSTDRMTLEGITVPAAVLDWRSPEEIESALQGIGFHGTRCPHQLDPNADASVAPNQHLRRLFLFDLTQSIEAMSVIAELSRLRESLSVKTVSLGGLSAPSPASPKLVATQSPHPAATSPASDAPINEPATSGPAPSHTNESTSDAGLDAGLDALIDQLDDLDV